jgi:sensory rhodopsin
MLKTLQDHVSMSFGLVFIAFAACSLFLYTEKDRVQRRFQTAIRVSTVYLAIAAINYYFMIGIYDQGIASGATAFPTKFRYIDWILTTPLMLVKFPLLLGMGGRGAKFMTRLILLDLVMVIGGYIGEINADNATIHWGFFIVGCVAWVAIAAQLFLALVELPEHIPAPVKSGVRTMGFFLIAGWAIYPLGFFSPLMGLPNDVRELVYNIADLFNKVGLCMLVYVTARRSESEDENASEEESA